MKYARALKYQRTQYGKKIRKEYELGVLKEKRCNMRELTVRSDEICNTITTVQKDNYILVCGGHEDERNNEN